MGSDSAYTEEVGAWTAITQTLDLARLAEGHAYRFDLHSHPYIRDFVGRLERFGIDGLLRWHYPAATELGQTETPIQLEDREIDDEYKPTSFVRNPAGEIGKLPKEDVDFSYAGAYSQYNWELFFHVPLYIAQKLSQNLQFEEAQKWFHYIFDPTDGSDEDAPQRYWKVKPFHEIKDLATIQQLIAELPIVDPYAEDVKSTFAGEQTDLPAQIRAWRRTPFSPHVIARMRTLAYQKAVVMKYLDNLIAWGDQLFRRDTIEAMNEATQIYILAASILGDKPQLVKQPPAENQSPPYPMTYAEVADSINLFSDPLVELESMPGLPDDTGGISGPDGTHLELYFCVPHNEKLLEYWDIVADRLFKIRNCMNIEGIVRQVPLFEPPIDPALLVKAAAAGLDISSVLNEINAAAPVYRFSVLQTKAMEFVGAVISLGAALLSAREKKDAEGLAALRQTHEIALLKAVKEVRSQQVEEAKANIAALQASKTVAEVRKTFYENIPPFLPGELAALEYTRSATEMNVAAERSHVLAGALGQIPQFSMGISGAMSTPVMTISVGGSTFAMIAEAQASGSRMRGMTRSTDGSIAGTLASYARRQADWGLQLDVAKAEIAQIEKQETAAEIRLAIAEKEVQNQERQIENAQTIDDYMRDKYTNEELYDWMWSQISGVYQATYNLAYDMAKKAERAFQIERADDKTSFISFGYWESQRAGFLAGEKLQLDLRKMDAAYLDQNRREYEITKSVSLAAVAPKKLLQLRETGQCELRLEEHVFDLDYPGHYLRRLKAVGVSVPAVGGPASGVNFRLTLLSSQVRRSSLLKGGTYAESPVFSDNRFHYSNGAIQSVVTSSAQSDAGMFEVNLRDERVLPFEGAGAISNWAMDLQRKFNQVDTTRIADVVLHLRYTAREGGGLLRDRAVDWVKREDTKNEAQYGYRLISLRNEFGDEWAKFRTSTQAASPPGSHSFSVAVTPALFAPILGSHDLELERVEFFAKWAEEYVPPSAYEDPNADVPTVTFQVAPTPGSDVPLVRTVYGALMRGEAVYSQPLAIAVGTELTVVMTMISNQWSFELPVDEDDYLTPEGLEDVWLVCRYRKKE